MTATPPSQPPTGRGNRPTFTVIRGDATDEELAALLAVLAAKAATAGGREAPRPPNSAWNDRAGGLRRPLQVGPSGWRASAWPR